MKFNNTQAIRYIEAEVEATKEETKFYHLSKFKRELRRYFTKTIFNIDIKRIMY